MDLLGKQLSRFRTIDDLERLARSLFDKDNQVIRNLILSKIKFEIFV